MKILPYSELVGFIGLFGFGMWVNFLQVLHSIKTKSTEGVNPWVYRILFIYVSCLLYCAVGKSMVFIVSNLWALTMSSIMMFLHWKYERKGR